MSAHGWFEVRVSLNDIVDQKYMDNYYCLNIANLSLLDNQISSRFLNV